MPTVHTTRSGLITEIDYNEETKELTLTLKGGTYKYLDVPKQVFSDLLAADSAGKYFHSAIKGKFEFEKI